MRDFMGAKGETGKFRWSPIISVKLFAMQIFHTLGSIDKGVFEGIIFFSFSSSLEDWAAPEVGGVVTGAKFKVKKKSVYYDNNIE